MWINDTMPKKAGYYLVAVTRYGEKKVLMARWLPKDYAWKYPSAAQGEAAVVDYWSHLPTHPDMPNALDHRTERSEGPRESPCSLLGDTDEI